MTAQLRSLRDVLAELDAERTAADAAIGHLDFHPVCTIRFRRFVQQVEGGRVPNGPVQAGCGEIAAAVMMCRECGHAANVCATHRAAVEATPLVECGGCKVVKAPALLLRFEPLVGA